MFLPAERVEQLATSVSWGSVPDWLAAVGTVGALFLGFGILIADRRRSRQAIANAFVTWSSWEARVSDVEPSSTALIVYSFNSGPLPVPVAVVRSPADEPSRIYHYLSSHSILGPIQPGESRADRIEITGPLPDLKNVYLDFVDAHGTRWFRQLATGKYVSRKQAVRVLKRLIG